MVSCAGVVGVASCVVNPLDRVLVVGVAAAVGSTACAAVGAVFAVVGVVWTPCTTDPVPGTVV